MAKDDYHVIVYQILSYLYQRLKKGEQVDARAIAHDGVLFQVNKRYWAYIIYHLHHTGLVEGATFINIDGFDIPLAAETENMRITPEGIEYLCDNSFMEKAKAFLKEVKDVITPFI